MPLKDKGGFSMCATSGPMEVGQVVELGGMKAQIHRAITSKEAIENNRDVWSNVVRVAPAGAVLYWYEVVKLNPQKGPLQ